MNNQKTPVKVIVCGSRTFNDYKYLERTIRELFKELTMYGFLYGSPDKDADLIEIVSGGAEGADKLGEQFAEEYGLWCKVMPADWDKYGEQAGFIRNEEMIDYVSSEKCYKLLVAFWDGQSKGTQHCFNYAKEKGFHITIKLF